MSIADELEAAAEALKDAAMDLSNASEDLTAHIPASASSVAGGTGRGGGGLGVPGTSMAGGGFLGRGFMAAGGPAGLALGALGAAAGVAGSAVDATNGAAAFLTPAARAYAVTGSSQAFAASVTSSVIGAVGGTAIGGFLLGATGVTDAMDTNQRAGQGVLEITESLRRIGVEVSPEQRQRMFDINQEREARVANERGLVGALVSSSSELNDVRPKGANEEVFSAILSVVTRVEAALNLLVASLPVWLRS